MIDILIKIEESLWLVDFAALAIYFVLVLKNTEINSSFIATLVITTIVWVVDHYRDFLLSVTGEEYKLVVRFAWYIGFALSEMLMMYLIYKVHVVFKKCYSTVTKVVLLSCFVSAFMHLTRYMERHLFATDVLESIYRWGVVSINISTAVVMLTLALWAAHQHYSHKKQGGVI